LRGVEEPQAGIIDDAALQIRIVVVGLEHKEFGASGSVHGVSSFGREREALRDGKRRVSDKFMAAIVTFKWLNQLSGTSELAVQATTTLLQLKNSGGMDG
jgi:hypothetical protein